MQCMFATTLSRFSVIYRFPEKKKKKKKGKITNHPVSIDRELSQKVESNNP